MKIIAEIPDEAAGTLPGVLSWLEARAGKAPGEVLTVSAGEDSTDRPLHVRLLSLSLGIAPDNSQVSVDRAALAELIAFADSARTQADSQFLCSAAEYAASDQHFAALIRVLDARPCSCYAEEAGITVRKVPRDVSQP